MVTGGGINRDPYYFFVEVTFFVITVFILAYYLPLLVTLLVLAPLVLKTYSKLSVGICKSYRRIDGKTAIVTGSNIGIGLETAKDLARRGGRVILACRNLEKGKEALDEIQRDTGSKAVVLKHLDLSSLTSVRKFCREIIGEEERLDILVNNAGVSLLNKTLTKDNLEATMQTNHYAHFLLTNLLLDLMRRTGNARVANVSSDLYALGAFDPDNLNAEKSFSAPKVYALTKLANIYFTSELSRKLKSGGIKEITVNALHPGAVRTAFLNESNEIWYLEYIVNPIQRLFFKTANEGAQTSIHVAISEEVEGISGGYFKDCHKVTLFKKGMNSENARILWEKSVKAVGLKTEETIVPL